METENEKVMSNCCFVLPAPANNIDGIGRWELSKKAA